jgi:Mn-dependent DtxR family transcriptional regulator
LSDEIKALKLSEAKAMRLKEKISDLALERIVQLYNLAFHDTKVSRVSPIPPKTKG